MDGYLNVVNNRIDDLVKISIKERKDKGFGVLFLDFTDNTTLNCFYLTIDDEHFPLDIKPTILERYEKAPKSIIYFNVFDDKISEIIEIDLDKNSNYHKATTKLEVIPELEDTTKINEVNEVKETNDQVQSM
jgi:hypothetical protein